MRKFFVELPTLIKYFEFNEGDPRFPSVVSTEKAEEYIKDNFTIPDGAQITSFEALKCPNCDRESCLKTRQPLADIRLDIIRIIRRCRTTNNRFWLEVWSAPNGYNERIREYICERTKKEVWDLREIKDIKEIISLLDIISEIYQFSSASAIKIAALKRWAMEADSQRHP